MSTDVSVHQTAEERGCDGVQSAPLHWGDKQRERCKRDPLGLFTVLQANALCKCYYLEGERGRSWLFFFSVFWSSVDSNNLTSSCWWEQDSRSMCPKGLFNVIVHDTSANHPLRTHAGTQARAHTHTKRERFIFLYYYLIFFLISLGTTYYCSLKFYQWAKMMIAWRIALLFQGLYKHKISTHILE